MPSFAVSITVLSLVQAGVVAIPRARPFGALERLRGPAWALIPAASVVVVIFGLRADAGAAEGITYLALAAVPVLAAVTLAWVAHPIGRRRGTRPLAAVAVAPLFAVAWLDHSGLAGESCSLALAALSCATLGALLASVAPPRLLKAGIVLMAVVDTALVVSQLLQAPNDVLNAAAPAAGLPQLQDAVWGSAVMGYGDLFIAGLLGGLVAGQGSLQRRATLLAAVLALSFNLLFLFVGELPATVPVALTLIVLEIARRPRLEPVQPKKISAVS